MGAIKITNPEIKNLVTAVFYYIVVPLIVIIFIFIVFPRSNDFDKGANKNSKKDEAYYQNIFCNKLNGIKEYKLRNKTRVDCLTDEFAIEVDFGKKWTEAIGQSLYYGIKTNRKPAIGLIIDIKKEKRFLERLNTVAKPLNIEVMVIEKE